MPKVSLLIFLFWTAHYFVWTPHFGWTLCVNYTVSRKLLGTTYYGQCLGKTDESSVYSGRLTAKVFPRRDHFILVAT